MVRKGQGVSKTGTSQGTEDSMAVDGQETWWLGCDGVVITQGGDKVTMTFRTGMTDGRLGSG